MKIRYWLLKFRKRLQRHRWRVAIAGINTLAYNLSKMRLDGVFARKPQKQGLSNYFGKLLGECEQKNLTQMSNNEPLTKSGQNRYLLKYTGDRDRAAFETACKQHDYWYHSFYFDNGFVQRGDYDIGHDIADYGFPENMAGMSVLDIGTGSGWFATYFEQLGADVTTVDVRGYCDFDVYGRPGYADIKTEKTKPDLIDRNNREIYYSPVSKGFWIMKELLGLRAEYLNAKIYDICPELFLGKKFDLVFIGSLLMHLREPIGALMAVRSVCKERLIANSLRWEPTPDFDPSVPCMQLLANGNTSVINWWVPNQACAVHWFKAAGFSKVNIDKTVTITVDKPFVDRQGTSSACTQTMYLVDAYV